MLLLCLLIHSFILLAAKIFAGALLLLLLLLFSQKLQSRLIDMPIPKVSLDGVRKACRSRTDRNGRHERNGVRARPRHGIRFRWLVLQSLQDWSERFRSRRRVIFIFRGGAHHQLSRGQPVGEMSNEFLAARPSIGQDDASNGRVRLTKGVNVVGFRLANVLIQRSGPLARGHDIPQAKSGSQQGVQLLGIR